VDRNGGRCEAIWGAIIEAFNQAIIDEGVIDATGILRNGCRVWSTEWVDEGANAAELGNQGGQFEADR
jgi:hypothetical protein